MRDNEIAQKYALALFRLQRGSEEQMLTYSELEMIAKLLKKELSFKNFLFSPLIDKDEKKSFLNRCFDKFLAPKVLKFLKFLIDKGKITSIFLIAENFKYLNLEASGILEVEVETATTLDDKTRQKLKEKLQESLHKTIQFQEKLKPQIIGGIHLSFNNKTLNFSIKDRLRKLKQLAMVN